MWKRLKQFFSSLSWLALSPARKHCPYCRGARCLGVCQLIASGKNTRAPEGADRAARTPDKTASGPRP